MYFWERKNGIRDSDEKSAGCGILVKKERECGIRTPPSRPCWEVGGIIRGRGKVLVVAKMGGEGVDFFDLSCARLVERLFGVNHQSPNGQKFNRQPSKKAFFFTANKPSNGFEVFQITLFQLLISDWQALKKSF